MFKVVTIVGTRPEIIKLSRVIFELDQHTEHILVHTGQNYDYELNEIFFHQLAIRKPDGFLNAATGNVAQTIGNVIAKSDAILSEVNPDAVLVLGDTNSSLSVIAAKRRKIPVFHMEAGNRCFDQRVPEEINRKIVDHISDINMVFSEHARRYLLAEGIKPETIIKTGSPMKEVLDHYLPQAETSNILNQLGVTPSRYMLVSAHREENIDNERNFKDLIDTLSSLPIRYEMPVVVTTHPRLKKKLEGSKTLTIDPRIQFLKPLGFLDYIKLQRNAYCVLSDSGTITEESSILRFPAITIRQAHERPEGMDETTLIMSGLTRETVFRSIDVAVAHDTAHPQAFRIVHDYDTDNVSQKVLRIILSYTDYINRTVWYK